jgi:antitoxin ParD1/3/4
MASDTCEKRTVSLPTEQGRYIDRLVKSGAYASASEVVRAGLRARLKSAMKPLRIGSRQRLQPRTIVWKLIQAARLPPIGSLPKYGRWQARSQSDRQSLA